MKKLEVIERQQQEILQILADLYVCFCTIQIATKEDGTASVTYKWSDKKALDTYNKGARLLQDLDTERIRHLGIEDYWPRWYTGH
jgi:hypothetical protein